MDQYAPFSSPSFDPNDYANAILAGDPYPPTASGSASKPAVKASGEDIGVAIHKLNTGIDGVEKEIKAVVTVHHEELLQQASGTAVLGGSLGGVRQGLDELEKSLDKLRKKITIPHSSLDSHVNRLQALQKASDVLRRTARFVVLARRLAGMIGLMDPVTTESSENAAVPRANTPLEDEKEDEKDRIIAKAALSIAELLTLLDGPTGPAWRQIQTSHPSPINGSVIPDKDLTQHDGLDSQTQIPLRALKVVSSYVNFVEDAKGRVEAEMESMVVRGLGELNQHLLSTSLQTAFNLKVLPTLVVSLVNDLSQAVEDRIREAFDLGKMAKEVYAKDPAPHPNSPYRSRIRTEPTSATAPQWTAVLWSRLEILVEEMAGCCVKVYTLEKVLKLKKDAVSGTVFLDEAMKQLENKPSGIFWTSLSRSLEKQVRDTARSSTFLQQTFSTGYPRLLRLFHEFFAKIAVHTDTVYTQGQQSPETILTLRALSTFEALYLSRSTNRLNEVIAQSFSGGARSPPGLNEGVNNARTVANELDAARFDPLLVKNVARNVNACLEGMAMRAHGLIASDRSAVSLIGPHPTSQQVVNASIATCLYHCLSRLKSLEEEYFDSVYTIIKPSVDTMQSTYDGIVEPLLAAIRRDLAAIIARLHRVDFGKSVDPTAEMGGGPSLYMKDLVDKLGYVKREVLAKFSVGGDCHAWVISMVKFVIRTFVLHVSIAKPLGESGKLQLTSDMTELEFALSAFLVDSPQSKRGGNLETVGEDYRALRAMRPVLFLENAHLASSQRTMGLPPLIVLHHILVRSSVPLPHSLHGWQEAEYVRWVDEHSEEESWTLVDSGLSHWEKMSEAEGKDPGSAMEYVQLARRVLANAKSRS